MIIELTKGNKNKLLHCNLDYIGTENTTDWQPFNCFLKYCLTGVMVNAEINILDYGHFILPVKLDYLIVILAVSTLPNRLSK